MNLIINLGSNHYLRTKLADGTFSKNDVLFCERRDEVSRDFQHDRVFTLEDESNFSIMKKLIIIARTQKVKNMLYISDTPPLPLAKIFLAILSFFCSATFTIGIRGVCKTYTVFNAFAEGLKLVFSPLIFLLFIPKFLLKEIVSHFILPRENKDKPFISVGENRRLFGVIYWYSFAKRAKMNGLFGYAFNEYMGVPVSLFHFPISLFLMTKLRFRTTYLLGFLMLFTGVASLYYRQISLPIITVLCVTFLLMLSNIVWEHASLGVYEILAWGFGVFGLVFFLFGQDVISGIALGLAVLSHLGVATLVCLFLCVYVLLTGSFVSLLVVGAVAFLIAGYWFVPYFLQRKRLTRMQMINEEWRYKYRFGYMRLVQFLTYCAFAVALYLSSKDVALLILALLPLVVAYINAKIKWLYSPYTVRMFQALVGMFCLSLAFNVYPFIFLLYFLYLPPKLLSWGDHPDEFFYSLLLSPRDDLIKKAEELFTCLTKTDRVGFELGSKKSARESIHEDFSVFLSYFLLDKDCEVFNTGMRELVKFDLYKKTCGYFNAAASFDELREAISASGVTCLVAFSNSFKTMLEENGFVKKKAVRIRHTFKSSSTDIDACIYGVPFLNERSIPGAAIQCGRNHLSISFPTEGDYTLKYSYDPGLIGKQGSRSLDLKDNGQGMICVKQARAGEARIHYNHIRLFRPSTR